MIILCCIPPLSIEIQYSSIKTCLTQYGYITQWFTRGAAVPPAPPTTRAARVCVIPMYSIPIWLWHSIAISYTAIQLWTTSVLYVGGHSGNIRMFFGRICAVLSRHRIWQSIVFPGWQKNRLRDRVTRTSIFLTALIRLVSTPYNGGIIN